MESNLIPGDPTLVENIVNYLKATGIFDEFRYECLADVDTKSSFQNLSQRVHRYSVKFLKNEISKPDLIKNEVRNKLRKHVDESEMLSDGSDHVVKQITHPKIQQLFLPKIIEVVHQYLDKEKEKLNKKEEIIDSQKTFTKTKTTVLDPIADILSFTCSKPKPVPSTSAQSAQAKVSKTLKVEKKKEEFTHQTKTPDATPKAEKKEEKFMHATKTPDATPKTEKKKEVFTHQTKTLEATPKTEKKKEVFMHSTKTLDASRQKKNKPLGLGVQKPKVVESFKSNVKESSVSSSDKISTKISIKLPNVHSEDYSPSLTKSIPSLMVKSEKGGDSINSCKSKGTPTKSSDKSVSLKVGSLKKEDNSVKLKHASEKQVKTKTLKISDSKSEFKIQSESSSSSNKGNKQSSQCSSSYDSSQGNDPDRSSSSVSSKEKHFSKRQKKDSSTVKLSSSKKLSDSGTPKKDNGQKGSKYPTEEQRQLFSVEESAIINSRSDSTGSVSSTSDSQASLKESSVIISSEETSDSSKNSDKKKTASKDKQPCSSGYQNLPPPSPPSGISMAASAEISFLDETQSSQESEFESSGEEVSSEFDEENSCTSSTNEELCLKETELFRDVHNMFLLSSSSSEFEGFNSSPEKAPRPEKCASDDDVSVSSVHTSHLSSFEDEVSDVECSKNEPEKGKSKKRFTIKEEELCLKETELFRDVHNMFLLSSSSSEFEGFNSSPDKAPRPAKCASDDDVSVSSVHTSDLSSFEDEVSDVECSKNEPEMGKSKKRFTIKEEKLCLKETELFRDVHNMFLLSSSSSEFEGFNSSPEKAPRPEKCASDDDVSVSSVHTSHLSSFEDEVSDVECSKNEPEKGKSKKRFTIKEAKEILKAKAEQQRLDALKPVPQKALDDKRNPNCPPNSATNVALSEIEMSPPPNQRGSPEENAS